MCLPHWIFKSNNELGNQIYMNCSKPGMYSLHSNLHAGALSLSLSLHVLVCVCGFIYKILFWCILLHIHLLWVCACGFIYKMLFWCVLLHNYLFAEQGKKQSALVAGSRGLYSGTMDFGSAAIGFPSMGLVPVAPLSVQGDDSEGGSGRNSSDDLENWEDDPSCMESRGKDSKTDNWLR